MRHPHGLRAAAGGGGGVFTDDLAVGLNASPFVSVYRFSTSSGFGTKYANPATLPPALCQDVAFSSAGTDIAVATNDSPYIHVYPWTTELGFGTKYANPATLPGGTGRGVAFSPAGNAIAVAHTTSPFITAYPWTTGSGFGTKYADPATLPGISLAQKVSFHPSGASIGVVSGTFGSPFIFVYPWTVGSGFGTKYANPATLPGNSGTFGQASGLDFSSSGNDLAVGSNGTPFIQIYPWSNATGFGTKYADPATLPTQNIGPVKFAPNDLNVACGGGDGVLTYPWSSGTGFGTKHSNPSGFTDVVNGIAFNADGLSVALATNTSPYIYAYRFTTGAGFGVKYANPATLPPADAYSVAFLPVS